MPSSGLPSYLKRGPTPSSPSYKVSRVAVKIIRATAGANSEQAGASYDDNELSDWVNDGQLSTAWINYTLERSAPISEVTMKVNNFRSRSYHIRISIDGKEVFRDSTQKSLGYFTAKFKPQTGKSLKIEMFKAKSTAVGANGEVEITGKQLDDGVIRDDRKSKDAFSIVELEIYERVAENSGLLVNDIKQK